MGSLLSGNVSAAFEGVLTGSPLIETDEQAAARMAAEKAVGEAAKEKAAAIRRRC